MRRSFEQCRANGREISEIHIHRTWKSRSYSKGPFAKTPSRRSRYFCVFHNRVPRTPSPTSSNGLPCGSEEQARGENSLQRERAGTCAPGQSQRHEQVPIKTFKRGLHRHFKDFSPGMPKFLPISRHFCKCHNSTHLRVLSDDIQVSRRPLIQTSRAKHPLTVERPRKNLHARPRICGGAARKHPCKAPSRSSLGLEFQPITCYRLQLATVGPSFPPHHLPISRGR